MSARQRLAIGDVYKVVALGFEGGPLDFTFEICGEAFVDGERFVWAVKHGQHPCDDGASIVLDSRGVAESSVLGVKWNAWEISRARPRYANAPRTQTVK